MPAAEHASLQDWQREMQACIVVPRRDRARLRAWLHAGAVDIDTRLDIYANAYVLRLSEALRCNYPALHRALGDADFERLAQAYSDRHPSADASIRWFGAALPGFLRETQPWRAVPVLAELAAFEWAIRHTVDAADAVRWTVEDLLSVPAENWGGLRVALHPSVSGLSLQWNAPQLMLALTDAKESASDAPPVPALQPAHWLVYRKPDLTSGWHSLSDMEQAAFECLQHGGSFGDMCACIAGFADDDAPLQAAGMLRRWVESGLLAVR